MLYLIRQPHLDPALVCIKVGYSGNIQDRLSSYEHHCIMTTLVGTRVGDLPEENLLHRYFRVPGRPWDAVLDEWYIMSTETLPEFMSAFLTPWDTVKEVVWEHRAELLSVSSTLDKDFWESMKDIKGVDPENPIDRKFSGIPLLVELPELPESLRGVVEDLRGPGSFDSKLRVYCQHRDSGLELGEYFPDLEFYYSHFGTDRCRASKYRALDLKRVLSDEINQDPLKKEIYKTFKLSTRYRLKEIKETLTDIYNRLGINKTPKAVDLEEYFETKPCKIYDPSTRKQSKALQLISIK